MVRRLPTPQNAREAASQRAQLDGLLAVSSWSSPLSRKVPQTPVEGPWWWRGDEDASQAFLREMGGLPPG